MKVSYGAGKMSDRKTNLIKSKERVKKFGEVFTPDFIVKQMCDLCEPDISNPTKLVMEPTCGNGNFLVEILKRKLSNSNSISKVLTSVFTTYGVDIQADNVEEAKARMLPLAVEKLDNVAKEYNVFDDELHNIAVETIKELLDKRICTGNFLDHESMQSLYPEINWSDDFIKSSIERKKKLEKKARKLNYNARL